jgi:hypothetical protein
MTEPESTARNTLRDDILAMGCDDFVSMADVQGQISRGRLADSVPERQQLVVDTVRSLLVDGLVEGGVIPSLNCPGFKTWPGTVGEVMTRFIDRFVGHYNDRLGWEYAIWFNVTAEGQQAAAEMSSD